MLDPTLKPLFKDDMTEQRHELMTMIGVAVGALDKLDTIVPAVQQLGRRHLTYGVQPAYYDIVGSILLSTLDQALGDAFTASVKTAWIKAYTILATVMKDAAA